MYTASVNLPILVVVPIEFAFVIVAIAKAVELRVEHRLIVTAIRQSDQPIHVQTATMLTVRSMSLNACSNDVIEVHLMLDPNAAFFVHHHDE